MDMDKMDKLKGQGFFTKVKNTVEPTADKILGAVIPGYDYRSKKNRLNTDFSVRNKLSRELEKSHQTLTEIGSLAYNDGRRDVLPHIDSTKEAIDLLKNKIENASYGLSPFFEQEKVEASNLIHLIEFDAKLLDDLFLITGATDLIYDNILNGKSSDVILQISKLKRNVAKISNTFKDRDDFLINLA